MIGRTLTLRLLYTLSGADTHTHRDKRPRSPPFLVKEEGRIDGGWDQSNHRNVGYVWEVVSGPELPETLLIFTMDKRRDGTRGTGPRV